MLRKSNPLKHHVTFNTEGCLQIIVETERLIIRSVQASEEKVKSRMEAWTMRWKAHDPFGAWASS